jgi:hypothetical protein
MPDISMCNGNNCPFKEQCYRFKATPDTYQTYADFDKRIDKLQKDPFLACDFYEPLVKKRMTKDEYLEAVFGPKEEWDRLHKEYKKYLKLSLGRKNINKK